MANTATITEPRGPVPVWAVALATLLAAAPALGATERAYSAEAALSRIDRRGADFFTRFAIVGPAPASAGRITRVGYRWQYDHAPAGLRVELCQQGGRCVDVSATPSGQSEAFAEASPARGFFMRARVEGHASFAPLLGRRAQVIVNWRE